MKVKLIVDNREIEIEITEEEDELIWYFTEYKDCI